MAYRGEDKCIFMDAETVVGFCAWHRAMCDELGIEDSYDYIDICRLCIQQNEMKTHSFIGTLFKETKRLLEKFAAMRGLDVS